MFRTALFSLLIACALLLGPGRGGAAPLGLPTQSAAPPLSPSLKDLRIGGDPVLGLRTFRLWPGVAPGAHGDEDDERPTLTYFRPMNPNGTAVVIAPGGAYLGVAAVAEGRLVADWFAARGVTAFVLRYRVGAKAPLPAPLLDAERAMRLVRAHAAEFGIDPARIGMVGFSAGGHLAAYTAVDARPADPRSPDPLAGVSSRPDFLVLAYPWINATRRMKDGASAYCVARGAGCAAIDFVQYAPVPRISADFPPTFIFHTADDAAVPVEDSVELFGALRRNHIPVELHVFETGPHGSSLGGGDPVLSQWPALLEQWLRGRSLLPRPSPTG